jgi:hypothetical protein
MVKLLQASFAGGEVSAAVGVRVDLAKYSSSLANCENFYVRTSGGVSNRPGLEFVCEVKDSTASLTRLIPFEFNTDETYVLEFGNEYMRVIVDGGLVVDPTTAATITGITQANPAVVTTSGAHGYANGDEVIISGLTGMDELEGRQLLAANVTGTTFEVQDKSGTDVDSTAYTAWSSGGTSYAIYEIATPYLTAELLDLDYVQSADVMTICHLAHAPRELTRTGNAAWSLTTIVFQPQQVQPTGVAVTVNTAGSETDRYIVTAVNRETTEESLAGLNNTTQTITAVTQANPAVVTIAGHPYIAGDDIYIQGVVGMTELNGKQFKVGTTATNTFELQDVNGDDLDTTAYTAYSSGGNSNLTFVEVTNSATVRDNTITWTAAADAESYNIYRRDNGLYGFIGKSELATFNDENVDPDAEDTPPKSKNPFLGTGNYPATAGYFQQRRLFGSSTNNRQRIWMTQTGNFYNFATSSPARDDDPITATIAALQVNEIRHFIPLSNLAVLTSGGEWIVGGVDDAITPSGIQIEPQSYYGAVKLKPLVAGDIAIFLQPGNTVRDLGYKFESDAYSGNDISILARHLFDDYSITAWDLAQAPYSLIWVVRDDGVALAQTYLREQEIYGWSKHKTRGDFKSVASIREGNIDATYFVVQRTVGGRAVGYIERLHERDFGDDVQDAFFVDAGATLDNPITITGFTNADPVVVTTATSHGLSNGNTVDISDLKVTSTTDAQGYAVDTDINGTGYTIANVTATTFELQNNAVDVDGTAFGVYYSGGKVRLAKTTIGNLWHLEGRTDVGGLANGYVFRSKTVTNGTITLDSPASRVHAGLLYTADLETLRLDAGAKATDSVQGKAKKISRLTVRVEHSLGFWSGVSRDRMREAKFGLPAQYGQPPDLITGDKDITLTPEWNKEGQYVVQQRDPLPLTILSLIPDAIVGGN